MAFLDATSEEEGPPPATPAGPPGGAPPGGARPGGPPPGGGPVLAALANKQRGPQPSAPGPGDVASSTTMVMQACSMLTQALPGLQTGTPLQQDCLKALQRLTKHVPQGAPAVGVQKTQLMDMLQSLAKNVLLAMLSGRQRGGPGGPGGQAGPPGAPAQAPMPSTPLPGA